MSHPLSDTSRALFNNAYVLPVAAVARSFSDGIFTRAQVARALNVSDNLVSNPFRRLEAIGAIKPTGLVDIEGQHFERADHPFWPFVDALNVAGGLREGGVGEAS